MHNLRDALLDPSPKGFADYNMATKTALDQQDVYECIARGELKED
jgi:hypothetical protein